LVSALITPAEKKSADKSPQMKNVKAQAVAVIEKNRQLAPVDNPSQTPMPIAAPY
jgi:hypothetical protein